MSYASDLTGGADLVGGLIDQGRKTQDYVTGLFDQHARLAAGQAVAGGDLEGGAGLLASRGDLEGAQALRTKAATKKALTAYTAGDFTGAKDAAAADGNAPLLGAITTDAQKEVSERKAWLANAADALRQINKPDGTEDVARRHAAFQSSIVPTIKAMNPNITDAQLASIEAGGLTNQGIDSFKTTLGLMGAMDVQKLDDGTILGIDKKTGGVKTLYQGERKGIIVDNNLVDPVSGKVIYRGTKYEKVGEGDKLVPVGGDNPGAGDAPAAPTGGVYDKIDAVATGAGAKPEEVSYLKRLGQVESSGGTAGNNGKSTGLFQFHPDTFERAGGGDINDVGDQTKAALNLSRQDRAALKTAGITPTDANVYIMHQQGPAGGKALLSAPPDVGAVAALAPVYHDPKVALAAVAGNIGLPYRTSEQRAVANQKAQDMTAGEFVDMWHKRWSGGSGDKTGGGLNDKGDPVGTIYGNPKDDGGGLDDAAIHLMAGRYILDGSIPQIGQGKASAADRKKIVNEATKMATAMGISAGDLVAGTATTKALSHAINANITMQSVVSQAEQTAIRNGDLALSLAPKGGAQLNVPVLDRWVQSGRKAVAGDPNVTQFDVALGTFLDEYAKVTTGSTGGTGTTDAARKEAYERMSKYATQGQLAAGIATMKQEMGNRTQALKDVEGGIRARLKSAGVDAPAAAPPPPAAKAPGFSKSMPPAMLAKAKTFAGSSAPGGSAANPFAPVNEAEYKNLPSGAHYIFTDGRVLVKK